MLLADCVLVCEAKVVRVVASLLTPNVDFERTLLLDEEFTTIFCHNFGKCLLSNLLLLQVDSGSVLSGKVCSLG